MLANHCILNMQSPRSLSSDLVMLPLLVDLRMIGQKKPVASKTYRRSYRY